MATGKTIFLKKLRGGSLSLYLNDVEGILPSRWFVMDHKIPRIGVPSNYALSIFTDSSLESIMKKNHFEVENMADLLALAQEKGYVAPTEEEIKAIVAPKRTKETLFAILKGGNDSKIKDLFESDDKARALEIAAANVKDLSLDTVAKIEAILGMAITEE